MYSINRIINEITKNMNTFEGFRGGGRSVKKINLTQQLVLLFLILSFVFIVKAYLVTVSYNSVSNKIRKGYKITMIDSLMLILLVIGLLG